MTELLDWIATRQDGRRPILLAVPGNHDLQRDKAKGEGLAQIKDWSSSPNLQTIFWKDVKSSARKTVCAVFSAYDAWWKRTILPQAGTNGLTALTPGRLPGDFSATIENASGCRLGVLGLNTAFRQLTGDDYAGKLALHTNQFQAACGGDGPKWARDHNACLLISHHPPEWLDADSRQHLDGEITNDGRFAAHLCGHLHESRSLLTALNGNRPRRLYQSRSLFGLETFGDQQQRLHGYEAGRIVVGPDRGFIVRWPRGYLQAGAESRLDRDPGQNLDRGEDATGPEVFELASPCRPPGGPSSGLSERDGMLLAGTVSPAYRKLVDQVRQRVQQRLAKPALAALAAAWGSDPVADLDLSLPVGELSKQIKGLLYGFHRKTKDCLDGWQSSPKDKPAGLKDDCRFILSELIKLTVDPQAGESELGPMSAAALAPVHLLCKRGGTADVVYCALADLDHLLERREDSLDIAADITVHFDDLLPSGEGEPRRQELLGKLWRKTMGSEPPGRIDGDDYDQLLARITVFLERDGRRYVLAAPGWRDWCTQGEYREWAKKLKLGLVLHEAGGCQCLLIEEPMVIEIARNYLELLETL